MQVAGILLLILGFTVAIGGVSMSGTAPDSDTLNLGLLIDKIVLTFVGCAIWISGAIFLAASALQARSKPPTTATPG